MGEGLFDQKVKSLMEQGMTQEEAYGMAHAIISRMEPALVAREIYWNNKQLHEKDDPDSQQKVKSLMEQGMTQEEAEEIAPAILAREKSQRKLGIGPLILGALIAALVILVVWILQS